MKFRILDPDEVIETIRENDNGEEIVTLKATMKFVVCSRCHCQKASHLIMTNGVCKDCEEINA